MILKLVCHMMLSTGNTVTTAVTTPDPFCGESARYKAW